MNVNNMMGLFIPAPAPAPEPIEANPELQSSLSEAASALVEIAGIAGMSGGSQEGGADGQ